MSTLAIKGDPTRGSEVIALLEMLEGHQCGYPKEAKTGYWFIDRCNNIVAYDTAPTDLYDDFIILTLEEFEEKYPYKVGDKVIHNMGILMNVVHMYWDAECNVIRYDIQSPIDNNYKLKEMLAEHLQPYKGKTLKENINESFNKINQVIFEDQARCCDITKSIIDKEQETMETITGIEIHNGICRVIKTNKNKHEIVADKDYEIVQENGKYYAVKKKPKYPKIYEECCDVLGISETRDVEGYRWKLLLTFQELLICRDAYWKIAGEQMGLGKPWSAVWDVEQDKYIIYVDGNTLCTSCFYLGRTILAFPTKEMRDAFYENFKELIEECKELL